ncbi:MAG: hypothetical protein JJU00_08935 [Opitutales bacterium]|nr:hypothetical protein [Opitutales bacterium]
MFKKFLLSVVGLIVVLAVVLAVFGGGWLNTAVKRAVETIGPEVTGTTVELETVGLSIFAGSGALNGLRVGNPEGFSEDYIISVDSIDIRISPRSLLTDTIIIERLYIDAPNILIEQTRAGNNLRRLMANIEAYSPPAEDVEEGQGAAREVIVRELVIEGGQLRGAALGQTINASLPRIQLEDIGTGEGGIPVKDVIELVLGEILRNSGSVLGDMGGNLRDLGRDLSERGTEAIEEAAGGAGERLRGILDR